MPNLPLSRIYNSLIKKTQAWVLSHYLQIAILNAIVIVLFLLRSAGYFDPYLPITVNMVIFIALISSIILLGGNSKTMFVVFLLFWAFASLLQFVGLRVWAERTSIYAFESLVIAVLLLIIENVVIKK